MSGLKIFSFTEKNLNLLDSEQPKLHGVLAVLSATWLNYLTITITIFISLNFYLLTKSSSEILSGSVGFTISNISSLTSWNDTGSWPCSFICS